LNRCLGGGIATGELTEFSGEASAGKTQLALQLLLQAQLPVEQGGLDGAAAYVTTEGPFRSARLEQMASVRGFAADTDAAPRGSPLDSVFVLRAPDVETLDSLAEKEIPVLCDRCRVRLVVVDSIAAVFRGDFDASRGDLAERSEWMMRIAGRLKKVARVHEIAVVVLNQATALIDEERGDPGCEAALGPRRLLRDGVCRTEPRASRIRPALGPVWSCCVTTRVMLHRTTSRWKGASGSVGRERSAAPSSGDENAGGGVNGSVGRSVDGSRVAPAVRLLWVLLSPRLPHHACRYVVETSGVRGVDTLPNIG
jgi:DNA-repair protein XRCC3